MPIRVLLRYLTQRFGSDAVDKLAESRSMRRAAQITAFLYHRGKASGQEAAEKIKDADLATKAQKFQRTFSQEVRDGFSELKKDIEKQRQQK